MPTLRTPEGKKKYQEYLNTTDTQNSCPLCNKENLKDFKFWKIIENKFPYDLIAKTHHMLISKRHVPEKELTREELEELNLIKESYAHPTYDWILEPTLKNKTIPNHFHIHLIIGK